MQFRIRHGDSLDVLASLEDESIDAFVMDPPYDLTSVSRGGSPRKNNPETPHGRTRLGGPTKGFMGKTWDGTGIAFSDEFWSLVVSKLKKGGVVKAFCGTRTFHKMAFAMDRNEVRISHLEAYTYGSGFPKSHNVSKTLDKMAGAEREVVGFKKGVGGENLNDIVNGKEVRQTTDDGGKGVGAYGTGAKQVPVEVPVTRPATEEALLFEGWGTALKPAWEPVVVGYKPR